MTDRVADPGPARRLALRAATAEPEEARRAWRELVGRFDLAALWDDEVYRLLPLVWHRLGDDVGAEHGDRLMGLYRKAWVTNQHLLRRAGEVVAALRGEGIESLVVRGLPVGRQFYDDPATRPVRTVDLLVHPHDASATGRRLEGLGYRARSGRERDDGGRLRRGDHRAFDRGTLDVIDVHTMFALDLLADDPTVADLSGLWDRAVTIELDAVVASTLSPTDHLLHALLLAWGADEGPAPRRIVDALAILDRGGDRIDWSGLVATARRHRCSLTVAEGLDDLAQRWGAAVPAGVAADLGHPRPDRRQRTAAWMRHRVGPVGGHAAARFVTGTRGLGPLATVGRAPGFLADRWHLDHRRQLPLALVQRLAHRLRRPRGPGAGSNGASREG